MKPTENRVLMDFCIRIRPFPDILSSLDRSAVGPSGLDRGRSSEKRQQKTRRACAWRVLRTLDLGDFLRKSFLHPGCQNAPSRSEAAGWAMAGGEQTRQRPQQRCVPHPHQCRTYRTLSFSKNRPREACPQRVRLTEDNRVVALFILCNSKLCQSLFQRGWMRLVSRDGTGYK